jgi:hypothetical protein
LHILKTLKIDLKNTGPDNCGKSCLQLAVEHSQFETASYLVDKGCRDASALTSEHPVIRCMIERKFKLVFKMIQGTKLQEETTDDGMTLLHHLMVNFRDKDEEASNLFKFLIQQD